MLFLNTLTSSVDLQLSDERKTIQQVNKEIKSLERKIEWIQVTDTEYASRTVKTNKITDEITNLKSKIVKIEKVAKLKEKWAVEDSVSLSKK
jgi:hypothetical protein